MVLKSAIAAAAMCAAALVAAPASAMPISKLAVAAPAQVDQVRWVCGPIRCWWRPGPRFVYGPRVFVGPRAFAWGGPRYGRFHRWGRW
jgi:hypothetical protein